MATEGGVYGDVGDVGFVNDEPGPGESDDFAIAEGNEELALGTLDLGLKAGFAPGRGLAFFVDAQHVGEVLHLERGSSEVFTAEVGLLDHGVAEEGFAFVGEDHVAGFENVAAVGDFEGAVGVLFDEEDCGAVGVEFGDDLEDLGDEVGREAHARFIEEEEFGAGHHSAGHGKHLLLATAEVPAFWLMRSRRRGIGRAAVQIGVNFFVVPDIGSHEEVFAHGHIGENASAFGRVADCPS